MEQQIMETIDTLTVQVADNTLNPMTDLALSDEQSAEIKGGPAFILTPILKS
ncbi:MAG: hypothetical protein HOP19_20145 [Acidobacteria bacterium]|nr:hypothetical protein [Acidobacteriota bacterium]